MGQACGNTPPEVDGCDSLIVLESVRWNGPCVLAVLKVAVDGAGLLVVAKLNPGA